MKKRIPTEFGLAVLGKLDKTGMTQNELIDLVKKQTMGFFDSSYLYKILTGQRNASKVVQAIKEILEIPETPTQ